MTTPIDRESVDPPHVKHPEDGIIRRVDEHYDGQSDVEQDPYGAWLAIQNLCAALDAAEAENKRLREALLGAEADKRLAVAAALREAAKVAKSRVHSGTGEAAATHILALIDNDAGAALDRALAAQRERDAKVAETRGKVIQSAMDGSDEETFSVQNYAAHTAFAIAAAIRAQGEK